MRQSVALWVAPLARQSESRSVGVTVPLSVAPWVVRQVLPWRPTATTITIRHLQHDTGTHRATEAIPTVTPRADTITGMVHAGEGIRMDIIVLPGSGKRDAAEQTVFSPGWRGGI